MPSSQKKPTAKNRIPVKRGSGNVFKDIGFPDAEAMLLKAQIAATISILIRDQALTQAGAAEKMNLKQPDVSRLLSGKLDGFSLERLIGFLIMLGQTVTIESEAAKKSEAPSLRFAHA